jgi:hypothetical protein
MSAESVLTATCGNTRCMNLLRFGLREVEAAMKKSMAADSMKVVIDPWS